MEIEVGVRSSGPWFLDPNDRRDDSGREWAIGLNPNIPTNLRLDAGNALATAALDELDLTGLTLDGGNGGAVVSLPAGDYDVRADGGNGSLTLTLPKSGAPRLYVDGGNGRVTLLLPEGLAARVEYSKGPGSLDMDNRFKRVSSDGEEGVYETAEYGRAAESVLIHLDTGNGRVTVRTP
jgi:hypothetical protein